MVQEPGRVGQEAAGQHHRLSGVVVDLLDGAAPGYLVLPDEGHEVLGTTNRAVVVGEVVHWLIRHLLNADERTA